MEAKRIISNQLPDIIEFLGDGSYYYNYDIQVTTKEETDETTGTIVEVNEYNFAQVRCFGTPDYKTLVKTVIRAFIDESEEFDLVNTYNEGVISGEETDNSKYFDYLDTRSAIKQKIKLDLKSLGYLD